MVFTDGDFLKTQKRFTLHHFRNLGFGKKIHENVILDEIQDLIQEFQNATQPVITEVRAFFDENILQN